MTIRLYDFKGANKAARPHLLPQDRAQSATNAKLNRGSIRGFLGKSAEHGLVHGLPVKGLYRFAGSYWFEFPSDINVARGPVAGDTEERTYWTETGQVPRMTYAGLATSGGAPYPSGYYTLGVPAPTGIPTATLAGTANEDALVLSRAYIYTYVTAKGEEGPPSPASSVVDWQDGQSVTVSGMGTAGPAGNYNITKKRIYRLNVTDSGAYYQFVDEVTVATDSYSDTVADSSLGEVLPSADWDPPPSSMAGMGAHPAGFLFGYQQNELCLSEIGYPHAWPIIYRLTTEYPIKAVVCFGQNLAVLTDGTPYVAAGIDPQAMQLDRLEQTYPCLSHRSAVDMGYAAAYASSMGLVVISGQGARVVSLDVLTPEQWRDLNPLSMHAYRWQSFYVCFYDNGTTQGGFIISMDGSDYAELDFYADAGWYDKETGDLFLLIGSIVYQWEGASTRLAYTWKSKLFRYPVPVNLAIGRIIAEAYPVHLKVWADGALKYDKDVSVGTPFYLPAGYLAYDYEFELSGDNEVTGIELAQSIDEIEPG